MMESIMTFCKMMDTTEIGNHPETVPNNR